MKFKKKCETTDMAGKSYLNENLDPKQRIINNFLQMH